MPIWLEQAIVVFLTNLFNAMDWAGVVGIMALESANIPSPSEVTMPLSGWLLVQARGGTVWQAIWAGGLWGALGCTIGSLLSYGLGAWGGRPLLDKYGKFLLISNHDLEVADRWFSRWGDWAAATMLRWEYRSIAWIFLRVALAVLVGHMIIAARRT